VKYGKKGKKRNFSVYLVAHQTRTANVKKREKKRSVEPDSSMSAPTKNPERRKKKTLAHDARGFGG